MQRKQDSSSTFQGTSNFFTIQAKKKLNDYTNPNDSEYRNYKEFYYYIEKKIIGLLLSDSLTEESYYQLYWLANIEFGDELSCYFIARDIWSSMTDMSCFSDFVPNHHVLKNAMKEKLGGRNKASGYLFKTETDILLYLPLEDLKDVSPRTHELFRKFFEQQSYFTLSDLLCFKDNNSKEMESCKLIDNDWYPSPAFLQQGQYGRPEHYQGKPFSIIIEDIYNACRYSREHDFPLIDTTIRKVRFHKEFNNPELTEKHENQLVIEIEKVKIRLYGMELLSHPENTICRDKIQKELDRLLCEEKGDPEIVRQLIKKGANVNCMDYYGHSPLENAVSRKSVAAIRVLIDNAADVDKPMKYRESIIMSAFYEKLDNQIIMEMIGCSTGMRNPEYRGKVLYVAVRHDVDGSYLPVIRYLSNLGASFTAQDSQYGNNCLMRAVQDYNLTLIKFIVSVEKDCVNQGNKKGETPLMEAVEYCAHPEKTKMILKELIFAGANPVLVNKEGFDCFKNAQKREKTRDYIPYIKKLLEQYEAALSQKNESNYVFQIN